jgi:hypothetical protein
MNGEVNMATGLYVMQDGSVMVAYGTRRIAMSRAQYKANGYKPAFEKLMTELLLGRTSPRPGLNRTQPRRTERPADDGFFDSAGVSRRGERM